MSKEGQGRTRWMSTEAALDEGRQLPAAHHSSGDSIHQEYGSYTLAAQHSCVSTEGGISRPFSLVPRVYDTGSN